MTSVEEVLELSRGVTGFRPVSMPSTVRAVPTVTVAPRATTTLELRRRWERRYRMLLGLTDVGAIALTVGLTVVIQVQLGAVLLESTLRASLLGAVWFLMLGGTHTRNAALFRPSVTEYRGVAHATGLAFGTLAIGDALMSLHGMQLLLLVAFPSGLAALLLSRWSWRRWLINQRAHGSYSSRTLVIGHRDDVEYVVSNLSRSTSSGLRVVGVTLLDGDDDDRELTIGDGAYPVLGDKYTIGDIACDLSADTIIVASRPHGDAQFVKRLS